jgi:hypothetical protein
MLAEPLANPAFDSRSHDRRPDALGGRDAEPWVLVGTRISPRCRQNDERVGVRSNSLARNPQEVAPFTEPIAALEATTRGPGHLLGVETASCLRPFARRRLRMARPAWVFIRARNPCVRRLRIRLG